MVSENKNGKVIVGIDPGSTVIGYGVISYNKKNEQPKAIEYGYIDLKKNAAKEDKLCQLNKDLNQILLKHKPDSIAVESIYFFKNAKTITPVLESKGVILFTCAKVGVKVYEYSPLQIKQTICGYGRGSKAFIHKLVQKSLGISSNIKPDDASDALAIALCHLRYLIDL